MQPADPRMTVVTDGLGFPEGPVARPDGSVDLVEIETGHISRVHPDGRREVLASPGAGPNGMAVGPDGAYYICMNGGFRHGSTDGTHHILRGLPEGYVSGRIDRFDPETGDYSTLYTHCGEHPLRGPNDIVFDREGGFWFTDFGKPEERRRDLGGLYYAYPDGSRITEVAYPLFTPNGVGLSPDERTVYVAETETARLWAFDVTDPGEISPHPFPSPHGGRLVCGLGGFQRFDSLAVTEAGNICVATLVTGAISVISPEGDLLEQVPTGDLMTTNICFGGEDRRTAWVTLSGAGKLVRMEWDEPGLGLNYRRQAGR